MNLQSCHPERRGAARRRAVEGSREFVPCLAASGSSHNALLPILSLIQFSKIYLFTA